MKVAGDLGIDLEGMQRQFAEGSGMAAGAGGGEDFLSALLEASPLKESGLSAEDLSALLQQMADGDFTGGGGALPGGGNAPPKELLAWLTALGDGGAAPVLEGTPESLGVVDILHDEGGAVSYQERAHLLRTLAELQAEGVDPEDLAAALQERLGDVDVAQDEVVDETVHMAAAGAAALLSALEDGGVADEVRRGSALGEQIGREMRAAGALQPQMGGAGGGAGGGAQQSLGEGLPTPHAASLSAENPSASSTPPGEFTAMLAAAGVAGSERNSGTVQLAVQTPVGQNGFGQAVGERVVWMVNESVQHARLQLNPPGLGPVDVTVLVGEDRTTVTFTAQNAAAREALEAELPRLRQMLAEQGQQDVDVNVSQGDARRREDEITAGADGEAGEDEAGMESAGARGVSTASGAGLVDHYA